MGSHALLSEGDPIADDYRVVRLLGVGGMGAVYLAEQLSTGVHRAVKTMHRHFVDDPELRRRFEQEARIGARIESDFVVLVLGAGVDARLGLPWIAMELLEGEPLSTAMRRKGAHTNAEALEVLRPLCDALGAAHRVGIVHRDLKPENVFLAKSRRPDERFTLKVLDFGIAKLVADAQTSATGTLGTPQWMAPEQTVAGAAISPSTDVWSLGLLAFALLTGRRYWKAASPNEVSLPALLREITLDPIDDASERARALGSDVVLPTGFDLWFARCVAREPKARFEDAEAAFAALEPILLGDTTSAVGPQVVFPAPEPVTRSEPAEPPAGEALAAFYGHLQGRDAKVEPAEPPRPPDEARRGATWPALVLIGLVAVVAVAVALARRDHATDPPPSPVASATPATSAHAVEDAGPASDASSVSDAVDAAADLAKSEAAARPMITFPGASFRIGSVDGEANERPKTDVAVAAFLLDRTLVTSASYASCVAAGRCTPAGTGEHCNAGDETRSRHPANCVTAVQAQTYCGWLDRRLPTEAEWEWAAAGKPDRPYPWGGAPADATRLYWNRCKDASGTCEVGAHPAGATPEGVLDLAGNVWEWTSSPACPYASPECGETKRITRGGGWCGAEPKLVRTHTREPRDPNDGSSNVGFRCARTL